MGSVHRLPRLPAATKRLRSRLQDRKDARVVKGSVTASYIPSEAEILSIKCAVAGEYEMSDREAKTVRKRIYSINKHNVVGMRFRTVREGNLLMVWRIR